jgi:hypothetical protein
MVRRVDSRDVLDPNGRTRRAFDARVVARYERVGPNAWDDYEMIPDTGQTLRVAAGIKIQVEEQGTRFRLRRRGAVLVAEWLPSAADGAASEKRHLDPRAAFIEGCIEDYASPPGVGLAAVIAKKLSEGD